MKTLTYTRKYLSGVLGPLRRRRGSTMLETIIAYSMVGAIAFYIIKELTNKDDGILATIWSGAMDLLNTIIPAI